MFNKIPKTSLNDKVLEATCAQLLSSTFSIMKIINNSLNIPKDRKRESASGGSVV